MCCYQNSYNRDALIVWCVVSFLFTVLFYFYSLGCGLIYILKAATSPTKRLEEDSLTYLNQGIHYTIALFRNTWSNTLSKQTSQETVAHFNRVKRSRLSVVIGRFPSIFFCFSRLFAVAIITSDWRHWKTYFVVTVDKQSPRVSEKDSK